MPKVDVRRGGVHAEFNPQGPPQVNGPGQFAQEFFLGEDLDGPAAQGLHLPPGFVLDRLWKIRHLRDPFLCCGSYSI
jgi:hypothetical protein